MRFNLPPLRYFTIFSEGERSILKQAFGDTEFEFESEGTHEHQVIKLVDSTGKEWLRWVPHKEDGHKNLQDFIDRAKSKILIGGYQKIIVKNEESYKAMARQINTTAEELARVIKEKNELKEQIEEMKAASVGGL